MKKILILLLIVIISACSAPKSCCAQELDVKKLLKFSTFYAAINGGTSLSDVKVFSVDNKLSTTTISTPYDYNFTVGLRKIARFGYENKAQTFYDGTEANYSDAATVGKVRGLEYLFEVDYKRQEGVEYFDQHHFLRYVKPKWFTKVEYIKDGFADIEYYEATQRFRLNGKKKLSFNFGGVTRLAEPYGYDPLAEWGLSNGNIHYTNLALEEGYTIAFDPTGIEYLSPNGSVAATSTEVWEEVVIPQVIDDYVARKRSELPSVWNYSLVVGYDYYKYSKEFWMHNWVSVMPYHLKTDDEYSYFETTEGGQWLDYGAGLIFGWRLNKSLGVFLEGKYNKYWNRKWHNFSVGANFIIL